MSIQKNGSNGTADKPKANGQHTTNTTSTLTVVKDEKPKEEKPILPPPAKEKELSDLPPVEDRVLKVQQLFDLTHKREKLQESLKKLNSLDLASENRELKITIEDGDEEWETHNTDAIKDCVGSLKTTITAKLQVVESMIKF